MGYLSLAFNTLACLDHSDSGGSSGPWNSNAIDLNLTKAEVAVQSPWDTGCWGQRLVPYSPLPASP